MTELLGQYTALPNLHPALVHFPIALFPVAVLFDLLSNWRSRDWLHKTSTALYVASAVGAGVSYRAGRQAADSLTSLAPHLQVLINEHADLALYTLWFIAVVSAFRIVLEVWDPARKRTVPRIFLVLVALCSMGFLFRTADLGGGLVYQHGIAVAEFKDHDSSEFYESAEEGIKEVHTAEPDFSAETAASRLVTSPNGALEWRPLASDGEALGSILEPAIGSALDTVSWLDSESNTPGLSLTVQGETLLVLPGSFGDVQVELKVILDEFEGAIGLAHHVRNTREMGFFKLEVPATEFVLGSIQGGMERELDRGVEDVLSGTVRLTVSAIGKHLKGLLGEKTVVHGHEPALPEGSCGLFLKGSGSIRILSMKVTPPAG